MAASAGARLPFAVRTAVPFVTLRFMLAAYGAAGASFLASLMRDYVVINHSAQSQQFFQLLYVVSMSAGFGVNAIALGSDLLGKMALAILALLGVGVILILLPSAQTTPMIIALLVCVLLLWIAGAQWSRAMIERGWVFLGRIREAIASVALAGLVLMGLAVEPAFLLAVALGALFSWVVWRAVRREGGHGGGAGGRALDMAELARNIVLTNAPTLLISYWALVQTGRSGEVHGFAIATAVRFSMYIYQVLVIGSVAVISGHFRLLPGRDVKWPIALAAACLWLPVSCRWMRRCS